MSNAHFFTDASKLDTQINAFGPIGGNSTTEYRVCSIHPKTGTNTTLPAYAICKGDIFYYKTGATCAAIIKPHETFNLLPIRYFIYRGLKADNIKTFFTGQNNGDDGRRQRIDLQLQLQGTLGTNNYIESLFQNSNYPAFEVNVGENENKQIGEFLNEACLEIMLENTNFEPKLDLINLPNPLDHVLNDVTKAGREKILNYLDSAAFYGSYGDLFNTQLLKFANKNKIYLDIRNENHLSLNYYNEYLNIKCGLGTLPSQAQAYQTSGWPILILSNTNINKLKLQLPVTSNGNSIKEKLLFWARGIIREGILRTKKIGQKFTEISSQNGYTQTMDLECGSESDYFKLMYIKNYENTQDNDTVLRTNSALDNLFEIKPYAQYSRYVNIDTNNPNSQKLEFYSTGHMKYIPLTDSSGAVVKCYIALEADKITFSAIPDAYFNIKGTPKTIRDKDFNTTQSFLQQYIPLNSPHYKLVKYNIASGVTPMVYIDISQSLRKGQKYEIHCFTAISMLKSEFETFMPQTLTTSHPVFIQLNEATLQETPFFLADTTKVIVNIAQMQLVKFENNAQKSNISLVFYDSGEILNHQIWSTRGAVDSIMGIESIEHVLGFQFSDALYNDVEMRKTVIEALKIMGALEGLIGLEEDLKCGNIYNTVLNKMQIAEERNYPPKQGTTDVQKIKARIQILIDYQPLSGDEYPDNVIGIAKDPGYYPASTITTSNPPLSIYGINTGTLNPNIQPLSRVDKNTYKEYNLPELVVEAYIPGNRNPNTGEQIFTMMSVKELEKYGYAAFDYTKPFKIILNSLRAADFRGDVNYGRDRIEAQKRQAVFNVAKVIAHELGHILYSLEHPVENYIWNLICNRDNWNREGNLHFAKFGNGHMLGQPTGICACNAQRDISGKLEDKLYKALPINTTSIYDADVRILTSTTTCDKKWS